MEEIIKTIKKIEFELQHLKDILSENFENKNEQTKQFKPTEYQIKRWKQIPPTKKTIGLLIKNGFTDKEIRHIKTQYDCHVIIENLTKKNKIIPTLKGRVL